MSIEKTGKGFKNVSKSGETFSKKPMTKGKAEAQLRAIEASKAGEKMKNKKKKAK